MEKICYYCNNMSACGYHRWYCEHHQKEVDRNEGCEDWQEES